MFDLMNKFNKLLYVKFSDNVLKKECSENYQLVIQTLLIKMAEKNLDHSYTVRTLLMIWWSCIDNGNIKDVSTPR